MTRIFFPSFLLALFAHLFVIQTPVAAQSAPELFTYAELVSLYEQETLSAPLQTKLNTLLTTPFVDNTASARGVRPLKPQSKALGKFLRVAMWNIERGLELEAVQAAFTDPAHFSSYIAKEKHPRGSDSRARIMRQVELLKEADVIVLNELDWGVKRTGYRSVVAELAEALQMNYAYGVEFVEIDPLLLGAEKFSEAKEADRAELVERTQVEQERYKGLHGTAILSRYKLENVRLVPFKFQAHDWYKDEKNGVAKIEAGKRTVSEKVFLEKIHREVRRGGRMMLLADISDPDIPTGKATVVATHLEARTKPSNRARQLKELLAHIQNVSHPVILAGDMNTSAGDATPTSLKREIKRRLGSEKFWITQGIKYATGVGLVFDLVRGGLGFSRTHADPTVKNVKFVLENPEEKFFDTLEDFSFADGGTFDFRGERARSANGRADTLSNSNERAGKGFVTTFAVERTIGPAGKYKLDWIFVKPTGLTDEDDTRQTHRFAPHFGRTLEELNYALEDRISDHNPIIADLPFGEPPLR